VHLVDNGEPVARQTRRVAMPLEDHSQLGQTRFLSTGDPAVLARAATHWLGLSAPVDTLSI
jgi:glutamate racemase